MNSKEKAEELISKMLKHQTYDPRIDLGKNKKVRAIKCAIILVDETIEENKLFPYNTIFYERIIFWKQVKEELSRILATL